LSSLAPEISGKQLELLKEIVPKLSRVAVFGNSAEPGNKEAIKETELAARAFGIQSQFLDIRAATDIDTAFQGASHGRAHALMVLRNPVASAHRKRILDFSIKGRLAAIYSNTEYVDAGGLMFYGANAADLWRKAATYVDKILKGAKPADLPVEQPTKFEFAINLKTAKQIGLTIPPNVLVRADKVIK
jgi:putative ABC transport system substrate-binding protein